MSKQYKYIAAADRRKIKRDLNQQKRPREIAQTLDITLATLYRELKRGGAWRADVGVWLDYDTATAEAAHIGSMKRRGYRRNGA